MTALINDCQGDRGCVLERRIREDLSLFHSREFQDTSHFVYRLYRAALGRAPKYAEWERDLNQLVATGQKGKVEFAVDWTGRTEFANRYPAALSNSEYVDKLLQTSGQTPGQSERKSLIDNLDQNKLTRANILLSVIDSLPARLDDEAFVTLCYFTYLKRDPDPEGFNYWLPILGSRPRNETALVLGFFNSGEYRARSGQP